MIKAITVRISTTLFQAIKSQRAQSRSVSAYVSELIHTDLNETNTADNNALENNFHSDSLALSVQKKLAAFTIEALILNREIVKRLVQDEQLSNQIVADAAHRAQQYMNTHSAPSSPHTDTQTDASSHVNTQKNKSG